MSTTQTGVELELVEYHRDSETYRAQYDQDAISANMAVVASLSEVMDGDPVELKPLHTSVDTGALDVLVRVRDTTDEDISITFTVEEYAITVYSFGGVTIVRPGHNQTDDLNEGVPHT